MSQLPDDILFQIYKKCHTSEIRLLNKSINNYIFDNTHELSYDYEYYNVNQDFFWLNDRYFNDNIYSIKINFNKTSIKDIYLNNIINCTNLKNLQIYNSPLNNFNFLLKLTNLIHLNLNNNDLNDILSLINIGFLCIYVISKIVEVHSESHILIEIN